MKADSPAEAAGQTPRFGTGRPCRAMKADSPPAGGGQTPRFAAEWPHQAMRADSPPAGGGRTPRFCGRPEQTRTVGWRRRGRTARARTDSEGEDGRRGRGRAGEDGRPSAGAGGRASDRRSGRADTPHRRSAEPGRLPSQNDHNVRRRRRFRELSNVMAVSGRSDVPAAAFGRSGSRFRTFRRPLRVTASGLGAKPRRRRSSRRARRSSGPAGTRRRRTPPATVAGALS